MDDLEDDYEDGGGIVARVTTILLAPLRLALSPTLLRTYLRTFLILVTSTLLFGVAVVAYSTAYWKYIPVRGVEVPVYLQYASSVQDTCGTDGRVRAEAGEHSTGSLAGSLGRALVGTTSSSAHPHGIANIQGLVSRQKYDVVVQVVLPRSERNLGVGNWMVGIEMRGPVTVGGGVKSMLGWDEEWDVDDFSTGGEGRVGRGTERVTNSGAGATGSDGIKETIKGAEEKATQKPLILARSRRPAILTYRSWTTETAYRILRLPLYVLNLHNEEETIEIHMMEGVEFDKGWRNVPSSLRLEIRAAAPLDVYSVTVRFAARLEGLRWVMYRYRLVSAVVCVGVFWGVEMGVLIGTWGVAMLVFSSGGNASNQEGDVTRKKIKKDASGAITPKTERDSDDDEELSDTSRTFPTLSSQRRLHYSSHSPASPTSPVDHAHASPGAAAFVDKIKKERGTTPRLEDVPAGNARTEAEADDEYGDGFVSDEPGPWTGGERAAWADRDSGIGTGVESSREREGVSRRKSSRGLGDR